jgi:hypothetical protein
MNLEQNKINTGFKIPNDFFEKFENNLLLKLNEEKLDIKIIFWKRNKNLIMSSAALIICSMVIVIYYLVSNPRIDIETIAYEDILHLTDWENELNDQEISEIQTDLLINGSTIEDGILNFDYTELN